MIILIIYMYGAMSLKYVAGAQCLYQGISFMIYGDEETITDKIPGVYYLGIAVFGFFSIIFSFGDIENSKTLQIVSSVMRIVILGMMYFGTSYYLVEDGI